MSAPISVSDIRDCALVRHVQRGSALIMGLIMLLVITMIGLTAMQTTTQQERMAGNLRDRNIAFQAAETALRRGEEALMNRCIDKFDGDVAFDVESNSSTVRAFIYNAATDGEGWLEYGHLFDYCSEAGEVATIHSNIAQVNEAPRYFVERQPAVGGPSLEAGVAKTIDAFKVTSRGVGGTRDAVVVLESSFKRE
ncbi:MAG: hypothetical protein J0M28_15675 [Thauera sp.]|nr:hypothetical protein [Thauera sp.]